LCLKQAQLAITDGCWLGKAKPQQVRRRSLPQVQVQPQLEQLQAQRLASVLLPS
jgi:hypothetical protein